MNKPLTPDQIQRLAAVAVPRYTSYPTAPHFHDRVTGETYREWLDALPAGAGISLYIHIPFCDTLCWFCGCHTKITRKYEPVAAYLDIVLAEARAVAAALPADTNIDRIHWGGGSPTILRPEDVRRLSEGITTLLRPGPNMEFAVEVDPRGMNQAQVDALAESGLTRVSVGVQDFDPAVQKAINRIQSFDETRQVIGMFRSAGVSSINIDAIYGLPGQHENQLRHTIERILALDPDRISLFGYAHVPWMKRHQSLIEEAALPDALARHHHADIAATLFEQAGYRRIGLDHFAKAGDPLAVAFQAGRVRRNFQGYTVDSSAALIGLGASSIGRLPQGYVQNATPIAEYMRRITRTGIATARGYEFDAEDKTRARVIERLMCDFEFSTADTDGAPTEVANALIAEANDIVAEDSDGLVRERAGGFSLTEQGRPFVRLIAARFDAHLAAGRARHSAAV